MKIRVLTSLLIVGVAFGSFTSFAAEKTPPTPASPPSASEVSGAPEWDKLYRGVALPAVWQSARAALANVDVGIKAKSYPEVAEQAERLHLAAHALEDQVKLGDVERQKRLAGALRQAAKIADDVIAAAEHKEAEKLAEAFRRLSAAMRLTAMRLPKEITNAAK